MEAGTVFTSVALMMFANGVVLAVVARDMLPTLRPAARYWQLGTMLIAVGCAVFAFGASLPRTTMLTAANSLIAFGLTAYWAAVQLFNGVSPRLKQLFPAGIASLGVFWFSLVTPNFQVRVIVVTLAWAWIMVACMHMLLRREYRDSSISRKILVGLFGLVLAYAVLRAAIYATLGLRPDFAVETDASLLNLLSPIFLTLLPVVGTTAFLLMCFDNLRRQLETAASTDYLTNLPNRRTFAEHGVTRFIAAEQRGIGFGVAILDIDHFKQINDSYGHELGDKVLIYVAGQLREVAGDSEIVARTGGEEFAVLVNCTAQVAAISVIERMRQKVEQAQFIVNNASILVTVSAGFTVYCPGDKTFEDSLRRADQALYVAKANGRNRVEISGSLPVAEHNVRIIAQRTPYDAT